MSKVTVTFQKKKQSTYFCLGFPSYPLQQNRAHAMVFEVEWSLCKQWLRDAHKLWEVTITE